MSHDVKYIGMDVHKEAIVIAVLNGTGKLVMETILETKASSILQFIHGLRDELHVTWEEGTWAAWLYDLLQPQVQQVVVCNPRRNALLKEGSKSDKVDARKLADLLRTGMLRPVYHGENGLRTLRELARSYQTISKDLTRVMNRLKALYRGWGIACAGTQVYAPRYREEWLGKIPHTGVRRRAELLYQQLDGLQALRREVRREFLEESRKQKAAKLLRQIPCIGPIRAGLLIALMHLHRTLQTVMGWTNTHLHQFLLPRQKHADPRRVVGTKVANENRTELGELIWTVGARLLYEYDFGDGWQHELLLEEVLLGDESFHQICVAGKRSCPPEDCGGSEAFAELLTVLQDANHPNHEEACEWLGDFDPESFAADEVNRRLRRRKH